MNSRLFRITAALSGILCGSMSVTLKAGDQSQPATIPPNMTGSRMIFPDLHWTRCRPEDQGMDPGPIEEMGKLMKAAQANGVLIRNGYLVAEWNYAGPPEKKCEVQSVAKSITSLMLGLALDDKLIPSLDARVKNYYPAFDGGPYTNEITFRHLVTMTSGLATRKWLHYVDPGNMRPGIEHHYHNDHYVPLAEALTRLFQRELKEVLDARILRVIKARMDWGREGTVQLENGHKIPVNSGYAFTCWTARDLARVGHLYLNNGRWKDEQLISRSYVKESWTAIPFAVNEYLKDRLAEKDEAKRAERAKTLSDLRYGLGWWTIKDFDEWAMSGNGGQFCMILPGHNIVMAKVNSYEIKPFFGIKSFYPLIIKSLEAKTPP